MLPYSEEHLNYLKKRRKEKYFILASRILILCFFLIIWEWLSSCGLINSFLYSSPSLIINTIFSLLHNHLLFQHVGIKCYYIFFIVALS